MALSWLALAPACVARQAGSTGVDGSSTTTDATAGATSSGAPGSSTSGTTSEPQPFRRFGVFHTHNAEVGAEISSQGGPTAIFPWNSLEISADGTLNYSGYICTSRATTLHYTWEYLDNGAIIKVVPDEYLPNGTFLWGIHEVDAVTIFEGDDCDDIITFTDNTDESGKMDVEYRYVRGELCAEGEACEFTFVWCDGEGPEACE